MNFQAILSILPPVTFPVYDLRRGEGILPLFSTAGKPVPSTGSGQALSVVEGMPAVRKEWRGHPGLVLDVRAGRPRHMASPNSAIAYRKLG